MIEGNLRRDPCLLNSLTCCPQSTNLIVSNNFRAVLYEYTDSGNVHAVHLEAHPDSLVVLIV